MIINNMIDTEILTQSIKQAGLHLTPQRIAICELLATSDVHPTAAYIYDQLREKYPSLSLMTVYNTLNTLVDIGVVNVLGNAGDDHAHYDGNQNPHINVACLSCHKIIDFDSPTVTDLENDVREGSGFKLTGSRVLFYGLCPNCQKNR